ncbi:MAG: hypothetical protein NTX84_03135 [Nitrospirae bacterium]|nr:hypothetical protein [Nitrospirota bacterium]
MNDQSILFELFNLFKQRRQEDIHRRALFNLITERLRGAVDDPHGDLTVLRFEERQDVPERILEAVGGGDGEGLRLRLHGRRDPERCRHGTEYEHSPEPLAWVSHDASPAC